jgi:O-antigen/teichoic acid export membrane protein
LVVASVVAPASPYLGSLQLAFLAIPVMAFLNLEAAYARGFNWMALATIAEQIGRPTFLILIGWLLTRFMRNPMAEHFVFACALAYLFAALAQHYVVHERIRTTTGTGHKEFEPRVWMQVSVGMFLLNGAQIIRMNTDLLLVGILLEPADVGVYTAAVRTATLVSFIMVVTSVVAQPSFSSMHTRKLRAELERLVTTSTRWIFLASLIIGIFLGAFGELILGFFGTDFTVGYFALLVLTIGHVLVAAFGPLTSLLVMTGHQDSAAVVHSTSVISNAVLNAILIALFGIVGAAFATAFNLILTQIALFVLVRRHLDISLAIGGFRQTIDRLRTD